MAKLIDKSLFSLTLEELKTLFKSQGFKAFNAEQVYNWVYKNYQFSTDNWTNISKGLKDFINQNLSLDLPEVVWHGKSKDGTRKFLLKMIDGKTIETVAIYGANNRLTLCVSSQVGCAIGCTFCHTGTMGLTRHLFAGEIIGQYLKVQDWLNKNSQKKIRISNIVFMGQGEPLHNFNNVKSSVINFLEPKALGLGQRKVTLSTSGLVPQIEKLTDFPPVNIAISLHAAHDKVRTELMPINKVYDLKRLFEAIKKIPLKAHRYIFYEYILIKDFNDGLEDILGLCDLLDRKVSKVNIIPFNEYPDSDFKRPSDEKIEWFKDQLINRGYFCTVRITKGDDILAACGQLKSEVESLNLWDSQASTEEPKQSQVIQEN